MESIKPLVWLWVSFVRSRAGFGFLQRDLLVPGVSRGVWHGLASPVGQSGSACPIDSTPREGAGDRFMVGMGAPCPGAARAPGTGLGPFSASLPFPPQQLTWSTLCSCRLFHSGGVPALPWGLRGFVLTFPEKRPVSGGLPLLPPLPEAGRCSSSSPETWGLCLSSESRRHLILACGLWAFCFGWRAVSRGRYGVSCLAPGTAVAPCAICRGSLQPAAHRRELRSEGTVSLPRARAPGRLLSDPHSACGVCSSLPISSARLYGSRLFLVFCCSWTAHVPSPWRAGPSWSWVDVVALPPSSLCCGGLWLPASQWMQKPRLSPADATSSHLPRCFSR